jgi:predicted ATPase/DNA-binding CsgD family transcriptional regulator
MAAERFATGNIPAESNAFIGRERDIVDLTCIFEHARLVTLCGPGGIGKTRLALRLARNMAASFPDGLWIADQADISEAERLVPLVAACLGIRAEPGRPLADTLIGALRDRTMLLILDTCEHLAADCAELAEWLLGSCPGLRVLATSREPLRMRGEVIWRVPPLGLLPTARTGDGGGADVAEAADCEAISLFLARATAVRSDFELTAANGAVVADICRTLDGVPLAIELAAARLRTLSIEQLQLRLASTFELLAHGDRTAPPRQQTLRATVGWSYELLTGPERILLSRLSVFRGWTLEAAEQVCADEAIRSSDVLDLLRALIDKSLVSVEREEDGAIRYRLLEVVRQFAAEQVSEPDELGRIRAAHRDWMLALAESMVSNILIRDDPSWQERVDNYHRAMADWANFNLALGYCADHGDVEKGLRLCIAMRIVWFIRADQSSSEWLDRFLSQALSVPPGLRSVALVVRAEIAAFEQQDYQSAEAYATAALDPSLVGDAGYVAGAERMLAITALRAGQATDAITHADAALDAARKVSAGWEEGVTLAVKAAAIAGQGDLAGAQAAYLRALEALAEGRGWVVANIRYGLGRLATITGDTAAAVRYFREALVLYRQVGARVQMARCLADIGRLALDQHDLAAARANLTESMRLSLATGQRLPVAHGLAALAALAAAFGDLAGGVRLAGTARTLFDAIGTPNAGALRRLDDLVDLARAELGAEVVTALLAEGNGLSPHQAAGPMIGEHVSDQVRRAEPWPGPLTDREREVALLVADGLSNRAVGEKLFISQATAARHLANIFDKLDMSSRAELIAWVLRSRPT